MDLKTKITDFKETPMFYTFIDKLQGQEFKVKHKNGKFKKYTMKDGKQKVGFWCPFCSFGSDRSANLKTHIKKCNYVSNKMVIVNKKTTARIPTSQITHDLTNLEEEIDNLVLSMREITDPKMCGDDREKYIGAMCWKFRNNFLPTSMFKNKNWDNMILTGVAKEKGYFYHPDFKYGILEKEGKYALYGINEIIPYLITNFKDVFIEGYKKLKKDDFSPPIWWWHKAIYGYAHPNDWEILDVDIYQQPVEGSQQWLKEQIQIIDRLNGSTINKH